ncbi:MAG: SulP family inorganic anion transporter [Zetaproteobacteria bacterium]|nr:SulP family inorganic anion transporter [Zetaproteobacteria bacterium]
MNIRGDILGGATAAVIALPLALAFGVASGLGATAGLYGAIILGFVASWLGGTPSQVSGPTGPMTVMVAAAVLSLHGDPALIAATILLSGLFQVLFGLMKIGRFVRYIPYPVISGFMSGIGVIIIMLQINPFLGAASDSSVLHILLQLPHTLAGTDLASLFLAASALAIVLWTPSAVSRRVPSPLIALIVLTPLSALLDLPVSMIGEIPSGFPDLVWPSFSLDQINVIVPLAFTIALLGTIDTLLTSIVADSLTQTRHRPDRELMGQGVGNALCAFAGAIPGAGATMRTVVNIKSGGTSHLSGMSHAVVLLLIVLFFAPFASAIPLAVLAGILIKVGLDILDYRFLDVWKESPRHDLAIMGTVFFVTVFIDLISAVFVGVVLASLSIVYRITQATQIELVYRDDAEIAVNLPEHVRIIRVDGAFFFGSSSAFENQVNQALNIKTMIIDIKRVPFLDITAIFTLKDLLATLRRGGVEVYIVASEAHQQQLLKLNVTQFFDPDHFCNTLQMALKRVGNSLD